MDSLTQRQNATARYEHAAATVNALFDALDQLRGAISTTRTSSHDDPIRDAEQLIANSAVVQTCLDQLRAAAEHATEYEKKPDLAAMLQTRTSRLFPTKPNIKPSVPPSPVFDDNP